MIASLFWALALTAPVEITAPAAAPAPAALTAPAEVLHPAYEDENGFAPLLPELTVTATRTPELVAALPAMITVLNRDDIERRPADQTANLLQGAPGVHVQKSNHGGGSPYIHGMTGKHILLMVDGIRLNNSLYRAGPHQYLNTIEPYTVERVEVVRGPASVLYGSDALGGAVNIVTRTPAADDLRPGLAAGGSSADASLRGRLQIDGQAVGYGLLAGVAAHRYQDLRSGHDVGLQNSTGYDQAAADLKLTFAPTEGTKLTGATYALRQYDVPKTAEIALGGKERYDYEPQFNWLTYAKLEQELDGTLIDDMQLGLSLQDFEEGEISRVSTLSPERRERNAARTYGAFVHFTKEGFANKLAVGGEWYTDRIESEAHEADTFMTRTVRPAFPDGARYEMRGVYIQNEWRPLNPLGILVGGRYSSFSAEGSLANPSGSSTRLHFSTDDFNGSVAANVELVDGIFAAVQAAQGFRAPNMEDFFGKIDFVTEVPNTALEPEKSNDYEGGVKIRRWGFAGEFFLFRSYLRDMIERTQVWGDPDGDGTRDLVWQRRNIMRAQIQGFESALSYRYQPLEVFGTYNFTIGDKLGWVDGGWRPVEPLRRIPPREGSTGVRWFLPAESFVSVDTLWAFRQDRLAPADKLDPRIGSDGTPGYVAANLRGGIGLGRKGALRLGVENVLDKTYTTHGSGIYLAGRSFYLDYTLGL